jgi:hypothetical protein
MIATRQTRRGLSTPRPVVLKLDSGQFPWMSIDLDIRNVPLGVDFSRPECENCGGSTTV